MTPSAKAPGEGSVCLHIILGSSMHVVQPGARFRSSKPEATSARACRILREMSNELEIRLALRKVKHKVFASIIHGHRLLVFRHPDAPEAGIQVPAGTVEEHERDEDAVLREACEETG